MFKSFAEWPEKVYTNEFGTHISSDTHSTKDQAEGVCLGLKRFGFAGTGENFPLKTWVEKIDSAETEEAVSPTGKPTEQSKSFLNFDKIKESFLSCCAEPDCNFSFYESGAEDMLSFIIEKFKNN